MVKNTGYRELDVQVSLSHNNVQLMINGGLIPDVNFTGVYAYAYRPSEKPDNVWKDIMASDRSLLYKGYSYSERISIHADDELTDLKPGLPVYAYRAMVIDRNSGLILENVMYKSNLPFTASEGGNYDKETTYKTLPEELKNYQNREDTAFLFLWRAQRTLYSEDYTGYIFGPDGELKDFLNSCGATKLEQISSAQEDRGNFNTINYADLYILLGIPGGGASNGQEALNILPKGIDTENALKGIYNKTPAITLSAVF